MLRWFIAFTMIISFSTVSAPAWSAGKGEIATKGPRRHLSTIVFSGVAGAILGLSTLSFYGRPQDKLSNIAMGAAFGIIIGATYTTFKAATEPRDFYNRTDKDIDLWAAIENPRQQMPPLGAVDVFKLTW